MVVMVLVGRRGSIEYVVENWLPFGQAVFLRSTGGDGASASGR